MRVFVNFYVVYRGFIFQMKRLVELERLKKRGITVTLVWACGGDVAFKIRKERES